MLLQRICFLSEENVARTLYLFAALATKPCFDSKCARCRRRLHTLLETLHLPFNLGRTLCTPLLSGSSKLARMTQLLALYFLRNPLLNPLLCAADGGSHHFSASLLLLFDRSGHARFELSF